MSDEITKDSLQIARLEVQFQALRSDMEQMTVQMQAMRSQLESVLEKLSEARGGWRVLMLLGGAGAALGSSVSYFLAHIRFAP